MQFMPTCYSVLHRMVLMSEQPEVIVNEADRYGNEITPLFQY